MDINKPTNSKIYLCDVLAFDTPDNIFFRFKNYGRCTMVKLRAKSVDEAINKVKNIVKAKHYKVGLMIEEDDTELDKQSHQLVTMKMGKYLDAVTELADKGRI